MTQPQYTARYTNPHLNETGVIEKVYTEYFFLGRVYGHISNIATVENFPAHAKSIEVRLDKFKEIIDILESYWKEIGFDFQPFKEAAKKKAVNPSSLPLEKRCCEN